MRMSRSVMAVGGVVFAAVLIGLTNPKAVHAVTAALVQVTNTASNPVVTQSVGPQGGNMVHLRCNVYMTEGRDPCQQLSPDGDVAPAAYTVPVGQSLVITSVDLTPENGVGCPYDYSIVLQSRDGNVLNLTTTNSLVTTHFTYPSGLLIGGGLVPSWLGAWRPPLKT